MAFIEPMHRNKPNITYLHVRYNSMHYNNIAPNSMYNSSIRHVQCLVQQ